MKTTLIIGGSHGIGGELVKLALDRGDQVINFSRSEPELEHDNLIHHTIDILKDELPELETIHNLVYCPGSINLKPISSLSIENFQEDWDINVRGAIKSVKTYVRSIKKNKGSMVFFSTVAVQQGMAFHSSIAAAKGALEGFGRSLAAELAPSVRVNIVSPSLTDTRLAERLLTNENRRKSLENNHPNQRIAQPIEIARVAAFLTSEESIHITGQNWYVDGGMGTLSK